MSNPNDIFIEQDDDVICVKTKVRARTISIDNPMDDANALNKTIMFRCEEHSVKVHSNGDHLSAGGAKGSGYSFQVNLADVALEDITITSPITGQPVTVKTADVAALMEQYFVNKFRELNPDAEV